MKQIALSVLLSTLWTCTFAAEDENSAHELIIRFNAPLELNEIHQILESFDLVLIKKISKKEIYLCKLTLENVVPINQLIKILNEHSQIQYAERNSEVEAIN